MPDEPAPAVTTAAPTPAPDPVPVSRRTRRVFGAPPWVLMYHSVAEITDASDDPYQVTVSPDRLDRQLRWLRKRGLRGVAVGELLRARAAGQGGVWSG